MLKVLITGASGQLGSELRDVFQDREDIQTIFLGRQELPLDDVESIVETLGQYSPDVIIHAGAYTAVDKAEDEVDVVEKVNHLASAEIAKFCEINGSKLISISTDYVFDGNSTLPLAEDAEVNPMNIYGETKLKGELAIQEVLPEAIIIRTAWVYSAYGNNFVKTMIKLMTSRDEISVINDQIGSPTYALDLAKVIEKIIDSTAWKGGIYHYSNEGEISWYDFACVIRDCKGLSCKINPISTAEYPTAAKRPKFSLLDKSKIKLTFSVNVPFWKDSLRIMLNKV